MSDGDGEALDESDIKRRMAFDAAANEGTVSRAVVDDALAMLAEWCARRTPLLRDMVPPSDSGKKLMYVRQCCSAVDVWLRDWQGAPDLFVLPSQAAADDDEQWLSSQERLRETKLQVAACLAGIDPATQTFRHAFLTDAARAKTVMLAYLTLGMNEFKTAASITRSFDTGVNPIDGLDLPTVVGNVGALLRHKMPLQTKSWRETLWDHRRHILFGIVVSALAVAGYQHATSSAAPPSAPAPEVENPELSCHGSSRAFLVTDDNRIICDQYACLLRFRVLFGAVTSEKSYKDPDHDYLSALPVATGRGAAAGICDLLEMTSFDLEPLGGKTQTWFARLDSVPMAMICPINLFFFHPIDSLQLTTDMQFFNSISRVLFDRTLRKRLCPFTRSEFGFDSEAIVALQEALTAVLRRRATAFHESTALLSTLQSPWDVSASSLVQAIHYGNAVTGATEASGDSGDELCPSNKEMLSRLRTALQADTDPQLRAFFESYHKETRLARQSVERAMGVASSPGRFLLYQAHPGFLHDVIVSLETEAAGEASKVWDISPFETLALFVNPWMAANWVDYVTQYEGDDGLSAVHGFMQPSNLPLIRSLLVLRTQALRFTVLDEHGAMYKDSGSADIGGMMRDHKLRLLQKSSNVNDRPPCLFERTVVSHSSSGAASTYGQLLKDSVWDQATMTDSVAGENVLTDALDKLGSPDGSRSFFINLGSTLLQSVSAQSPQWVGETKMKRDLAEVVQILVPQLDRSNSNAAWTSFYADMVVNKALLLKTAKSAASTAVGSKAITAAGSWFTSATLSSMFLAGTAVLALAAVGASFFILLSSWAYVEVAQLRELILCPEAAAQYTGDNGLRRLAPNDMLRNVTLEDIAQNPSMYLPWLAAASEERSGVARSPKRLSVVAMLQDSVYAAAGSGRHVIEGLGSIGIRDGYEDTRGVLAWFRGSYAPTMLQEDFGHRQDLMRLAFGFLVPKQEWLQKLLANVKEPRQAFLAGIAGGRGFAKQGPDEAQVPGNGGVVYAEVFKDGLELRLESTFQSTVARAATDETQVRMSSRLRFILGGSARGQALSRRFRAALQGLRFVKQGDISPALVVEVQQTMSYFNYLEMYDTNEPGSEATMIVPFLGLLSPKCLDRLPSLGTCEKMARITESRGGATPFSLAADSFYVQSTDATTSGEGSEAVAVHESSSQHVWLDDLALTEAGLAGTPGQRLVTGIPPCIGVGRARAFQRVRCLNRQMLCSRWEPADSKFEKYLDDMVEQKLDSKTSNGLTAQRFREAFRARMNQAGDFPLSFPVDNLPEILGARGSDVGDRLLQVAEATLAQYEPRVLVHADAWDGAEWIVGPLALAANQFWARAGAARLGIDTAVGLAIICSTCNYWVHDIKPDSSPAQTEPGGPAAGTPTRRPLPATMFGIMTIERQRFFVASLKKINENAKVTEKSADAKTVFRNLFARVFETCRHEATPTGYTMVHCPWSGNKVECPQTSDSFGFRCSKDDHRLATRLYDNIKRTNPDEQDDEEALKKRYTKFIDDIGARFFEAREAGSASMVALVGDTKLTVDPKEMQVPVVTLARAAHEDKSVADLTFHQFVQTFVNSVLFGTDLDKHSDERQKQNGRSQWFIDRVCDGHVPTLDAPLRTLNWFLQGDDRQLLAGDDDPRGDALYKLILLAKTPCGIERSGRFGVLRQEVASAAALPQQSGAYKLAAVDENRTALKRLTTIMLAHRYHADDPPEVLPSVMAELDEWCTNVGKHGLTYTVAIDCGSGVLTDCAPFDKAIPFVSPMIFGQISRGLQLLKLRLACELANRSDDTEALKKLVPAALRDRLQTLETEWIDNTAQMRASQLPPAEMFAEKQMELAYIQRKYLGLLKIAIDRAYHGAEPPPGPVATEIKNARSGAERMPSSSDSSMWSRDEVATLQNPTGERQEVVIQQLAGRDKVRIDGRDVSALEPGKSFERSFAICFATCLHRMCNSCISNLFAAEMGEAAEALLTPCDVFQFAATVVDDTSTVSEGRIPLMSGTVTAIETSAMISEYDQTMTGKLYYVHEPILSSWPFSTGQDALVWLLKESNDRQRADTFEALHAAGLNALAEHARAFDTAAVQCMQPLEQQKKALELLKAHESRPFLLCGDGIGETMQKILLHAIPSCPYEHALCFVIGATVGRVTAVQVQDMVLSVAARFGGDLGALSTNGDGTNLSLLHKTMNALSSYDEDQEQQTSGMLALLTHYMVAQLMFLSTNVFKIEEQGRGADNNFVVIQGAGFFTGQYEPTLAHQPIDKRFNDQSTSKMLRLRLKQATLYVRSTIVRLQNACGEFVRAIQARDTAGLIDRRRRVLSALACFVPWFIGGEQTLIELAESFGAKTKLLNPAAQLQANPLTVLLQDASFLNVSEPAVQNSRLGPGKLVNPRYDDFDSWSSLTLPCSPVITVRQVRSGYKGDYRKEMVLVRQKHDDMGWAQSWLDE